MEPIEKGGEGDALVCSASVICMPEGEMLLWFAMLVSSALQCCRCLCVADVVLLLLLLCCFVLVVDFLCLFLSEKQVLIC